MSRWAAAGATAGKMAGYALVTRPQLEMPVEDLANWIPKFVLESRKAEGSKYLPKTLYTFIYCFKQYYKASGVHNVNPLDMADPWFGSFGQTHDGEMQHLPTKGFGGIRKKAEPITEGEEAMLLSTGQLGCESAHALLKLIQSTFTTARSSV